MLWLAMPPDMTYLLSDNLGIVEQVDFNVLLQPIEIPEDKTLEQLFFTPP